ncbi:NAD(P)/FAD-dependent oxidoreductase [Hoeflea sp.]|uniref:NAD(P)/FAD-dependent oxidoreductase n=1 Tax=Hoeflea sp. TaxID=1940281 RepID=UPI0037495219
MLRTDTLIIGAGLAGLTAARHLRDNGVDVAVIEKSRSPGGRMSTRRSDHGSFDHGAQYFTSRTPAFTALVNQLAENGDVAPWQPNGKDSTWPWWVGQPGMSAMGKALAGGLDIRFQAQVSGINRIDDGYSIEIKAADKASNAISAARVVAAIPAPQAASLLVPLDPAFTAIEQVVMAPCWAAMVAFENSPAAVPDILRGDPADPLALIARNSSKPGRNGETFVLHASPAWSRERLEDNKEVVADDLLAAMRHAVAPYTILPEPVHCVAHRWRHAQTETPLDAPFIADDTSTLLACGDWCIGGRVEAAHQSGLALARHILSL